MKNLTTRGSVLALALMASGCATPVPQVLKPTDIPAKFTSPIPSSPDVWPKQEWWHGFGSTELDGLIAEAQKNNLNIAVAFANVLQAEAQTNVARASLFPSLDLEPAASRAQSSASQISTGGGHALKVPGGTANSFSLTSNASWSLDFWGLAQDNLRAAVQTLKAQRYAQQVVALTETADVGTTYLDVLSLRDQVSIAKKNVEEARRVLQVTRDRLKAGTDSELDLAQEEALVEGQEANIPVLEEQEHEALLALAILLGRAPEGFDVQAQNLDGISTPLVQPGLPSELLLRRPDIAEAEANLASAHANVDAARAAFFPAIGLTGSAGTAGSVTGTLFHASTFEWSAGASALQTLMDGGKLFAERDVAKAEQLSLVATYRQTVISAFSDVETRLGQVSHYAAEEASLEQEVKSAANAFRISQLQYREGIVDITTVISTEQTLFNAETTLSQAKLVHAQSVVGLYQSLGGGWSQNPEDATQALPGPDQPHVKAPVPRPQNSIWRVLFPNSFE